MVRIGIAVLLTGSAPLIVVIALTVIGFWPAPNRHAQAPGLLFFVSFWPGIISVSIGLARVFMRRRRGPAR